MTFSGQPTFEDEKVLNYELGAKTQLADGRVTFNAAVFFSDIDDLQVIADAGSCSSRIVLNAQAESIGAEVELFARPNDELGLRACRRPTCRRRSPRSQTDAHRRADRGHPRRQSPADVAGVPGGGERDVQLAVLAALEAFANFTFQHVGSSYTQLADQEPPFGCVGCPGAPGFFDFGDPTITQLHVRAGAAVVRDRQPALRRARTDAWEAAAFVNNLWDERAFLSLDRERGFARPRRLPDEHAAHLRCVAAHEFLERDSSSISARSGHRPPPRGRSGEYHRGFVVHHLADEVPHMAQSRSASPASF